MNFVHPSESFCELTTMAHQNIEEESIPCCRGQELMSCEPGQGMEPETIGDYDDWENDNVNRPLLIK